MVFLKREEKTEFVAKEEEMTLTIDLPRELEERLNEEAKRIGLEPSQLALQIVYAALPKPENGSEIARPFYETASPEEWIQALHEWAESHEDWPVLPPGADSRESIYEERVLRILGLAEDYEE